MTTAPALAGSSSIKLNTGVGRAAAFEASLEFFLTPVVPFLRDPEVSEIMVNGCERIYIEKAGKVLLTESRFPTEQDVQAAANNVAQFVGQSLSQDRPLLDGRLPDGSRVTIVLGPLASCGTTINIRRFARNSGTPNFLLEKKACTRQCLEFLLLAVMAHQNILISGGSGSGKTTLLNVMTHAFKPDERIVVIEETRELQVQREHVVQLEARPVDQYGRGQISVRDLFNSALRMRPDRIVVGEVRRGEALDMVQAMTSGHHGSLSTLHASTPSDTCYRLETMAMMSDIALPLTALRRQIASAVDLVVQTSRLPSGRRLVTHVSQIHYNETSQNYTIEDIFAPKGDIEVSDASWTGLRPRMADAQELPGLEKYIIETAPIFASKP
jgi:pilus assembly protein CpaF